MNAKTIFGAILGTTVTSIISSSLLMAASSPAVASQGFSQENSSTRNSQEMITNSTQTNACYKTPFGWRC